MIDNMIDNMINIILSYLKRYTSDDYSEFSGNDGILFHQSCVAANYRHLDDYICIRLITSESYNIDTYYELPRYYWGSKLK